MTVTVEELWPMNIRLSISNCLDMILSADCSIDDRDGERVMANKYGIVYQFLSRRDTLGGLFD